MTRNGRLILELVGVLAYLAAHVPLALVYALGSSLPISAPWLYWASIAAGYAGMAGLAARLRVSGRPLRRALDAWLVAAVPALAFTAILIRIRWPLEFPSWEAHGFGAAGGEANAVLYPWLHGGIWAVAAFSGPRRGP